MLGVKEELRKQAKSGKTREKKVKASETVTAKRKEPDEKQEEAIEVTGKRQAENAGKSPGRLNEKQKKAAHSPARRTAVIAGPGTGKTKTIDCETSVSGKSTEDKPGSDYGGDLYEPGRGEIRDRLQKDW